MPKYIITATKTYELEIEASDADEAIEQAFCTPLTEWCDEYEMQLDIETVKETEGA